jgi:hypothetical protein
MLQYNPSCSDMKPESKTKRITRALLTIALMAGIGVLLALRG